MSKYANFLTLDTETATLPIVNEMNLSIEDKKKIAIAKPLVYDIGWTIANRTQGTILKRNYLVAEIFCVSTIFDTAYYAWKRPLYLEMINKGEVTVLPWRDIMRILIEDMQDCKYVTAFNSMFDFKKAIPFTELYISKLYSPDYYNWENLQRKSCKSIISSKRPRDEHDFDPKHFILRGEKYPMLDIWGIACAHLLNNKKYKKMCLETSKISNSGFYFSTNAEDTMQYLSNRFDFIEDHTALSDAEIETEILFSALKRGKIIEGIVYFPFKMLGDTVEFTMKAKGITRQMAENVAEKIRNYLPQDIKIEKLTPYQKQTFDRWKKLKKFIDKNWGE